MIAMPNSPTIPAKCLGFYLNGREDGLRFKLSDVLEQVLPSFEDESQPMRSPRDLVYEACTAAANKLRGGRGQRYWESAHKSEIEASGVSASQAYDAYLLGCADETAAKLESKVTDTIFDEVDNDDVADEPDEDNEDEGDDDDED